MALRGRTVVAGSGDAGYTNVGEEGNDISDTDPDCSVARPFYPSNRFDEKGFRASDLSWLRFGPDFVLNDGGCKLTAACSAYVVSVSSTYFSTRNTPYCMAAQAAAASSAFIIPPCTLLR
jgi:hypothetical protein